MVAKIGGWIRIQVCKPGIHMITVTQYLKIVLDQSTNIYHCKTKIVVSTKYLVTTCPSHTILSTGHIVHTTKRGASLQPLGHFTLPA